jgi:hypothetical protein
MKRATVVGAIGFLLGAATAPRAANQNETLTLLCTRARDNIAYLQRTQTEAEKRVDTSQRDAAIRFLLYVVCVP